MTGVDGSAAVPALDDVVRFKHAFRRHPAGVAIVTAVTAGGPVGLTASSVASVSADPAVLSFSVARGGRSAAALLAATGPGEVPLGVHLLPAGRAGLADVFARSGTERFTLDQGWEWVDGRPRLPDALATLTCVVRALVPVGPSTLVLADVREVRLGSGEPLVHHDRTYRALGRLLPVGPPQARFAPLSTDSPRRNG